MKADHFSTDVWDFIFLLNKYDVNYVIVGGEAVIFYGYARLTGDVDFFFESSYENTSKLYKALNEFWDGNIPGIKNQAELQEPGFVIQFGVPPNRIDLLNELENVPFDEAWANKNTISIDFEGKKIPLHFIGIDQLIKNKEAIQRHKDMEDLNYLKRVKKSS